MSRSFKRHETVDENAIKSTYDKLNGIIKTRPVTEMSASYPSDEVRYYLFALNFCFKIPDTLTM